MITQFFGSYLLNHGYVTTTQIAKAIDDKNSVRMKLGVLAINAGYMTSEQVELVNVEQANRDKRFGDLAVEMGYVTSEQIDKLLAEQPKGHLLLGQALVNDGVLTNAQLEEAVNDYKKTNQLSDDDISDEQNEKIADLVSEFYHFEKEANAKIYTKYISLLIKNLIRFIGDDFIPLEAPIVSAYKAKKLVVQNIGGEVEGTTAIEADENTYRILAERFAKEAITDNDYANAAIGEFLNLNNGLFTVNMSNDAGLELTLAPQDYYVDKTIDFASTTFCIPIKFNFGTANFFVSIK